MPAFDGQKVKEWFRHFEKNVLELKWPRKRWVGLVVTFSKGKALKAYERMGVEDLQGYEKFKLPS